MCPSGFFSFLLWPFFVDPCSLPVDSGGGWDMVVSTMSGFRCVDPLSVTQTCYILER
jgi:hypothetical protein